MKLLELVTKNRSYRGYDESVRLTEEQLLSLVELARFSASSVNLQPLKFLLVRDEAEVRRLQPLTGWARALPERHLPDEGHRPTSFIVICHDKRLAENAQRFWKDVGIVAQSMLLGAVELGFGGCMIGNFSPEKVMQAFDLPEHLVPQLILALGKPQETILLEDFQPGGSISYYRDEQDRHHVPKRTLEELIIR